MSKFDFLFKVNVKMLNISSVLISVKRKMGYSTKILKRNEDLITCKKSDTLYVIGLGPSLRNVDLSKIDGDVICSNRFYKFEGAAQLIPQFYCLMDNDFFTGNAVNDFLKAYEKYPETKFILNGKYKKEIEGLLGNRENIFYTYGWGKMVDENSSLDFTKNLPLALNVVCRMIETGIYMGYKKIVLLGCDFNSFATSKNKHCYDDKEDGVHWKLSYELFCYSFAAKEHEMLELIARKRNIEILNATEGSLIDAYERTSI